MNCGIRAVCLFDPPPPDRATMQDLSNAVMRHLLDHADSAVTDPVVEADPDHDVVVTIQIEVEGDSPVEAFAKGRQRILEAVDKAGWKVRSIDGASEPDWQVQPRERDHEPELVLK